MIFCTHTHRAMTYPVTIAKDSPSSCRKLLVVSFSTLTLAFLRPHSFASFRSSRSNFRFCFFDIQSGSPVLSAGVNLCRVVLFNGTSSKPPAPASMNRFGAFDSLLTLTFSAGFRIPSACFCSAFTNSLYSVSSDSRCFTAFSICRTGIKTLSLWS